MQWDSIRRVFFQKLGLALLRGSAAGVLLSGLVVERQNVFAQQYYSSRSPQYYQTIQREIVTPAPDFWEYYRSSDGTLVTPSGFQQRPRLWMTYHFSYENSYAFRHNDQKETDWSLPDISLSDSELLAPIPTLASQTNDMLPKTPSFAKKKEQTPDVDRVFSSLRSDTEPEKQLESTSASKAKIRIPHESLLMRTTTTPSPYIR
ncbi:MAG: hypothetical protein LBJ67_06470 [Planctomycetaceae bacterium]|jgi:hypothetical protein|nr:hypothetical protein [Planctomycetaceae bacterium]